MSAHVLLAVILLAASATADDTPTGSAETAFKVRSRSCCDMQGVDSISCVAMSGHHSLISTQEAVAAGPAFVKFYAPFDFFLPLVRA
jgi:hypothetical protein